MAAGVIRARREQPLHAQLAHVAGASSPVVGAWGWMPLQRLALHPTKLAFPYGEFVRFVDMFDAIFKLTVTRG
jgi:hypothetical protein